MADGYWEIFHLSNDIVYAKGGKDAGKTKFLAQMKVILMLAFPWYNVFSLRQDLKQHSGSTKEHFIWAMSLLSKILDFPVDTIFKITKAPLEIRHKYQGNVLKTFSGDTNTENKVSSQEIGGIEGIIGLFDYDEPTSNKTPTDEKIQEEIAWWRIAINSNMERGTEFATPLMLAWQMVVVMANPWQPNSSFDILYHYPFIHISRQELKETLITKYKYRQLVKNFDGEKTSLLILITNAMIIEPILQTTEAGKKEIAKRKHYFAKPNISAYEETFYIGLSGYIEGGVYEHYRNQIKLKPALAKSFPKPIALSFGVDYANKRDKMVLSIVGYSAQYDKILGYKSMAVSPQEYRDVRHRDIHIANIFVIEMLRWLKALDMPKTLRYRCVVDGDFFRQTLDKALLDFLNQKPQSLSQKQAHHNMAYSIKFIEKENLEVRKRVKDDKELMSSGRLVVDEKLFAGWLQEIATVQWRNDNQNHFEGNDDEIQAFHYARDPYRLKLMKGKRYYETL